MIKYTKIIRQTNISVSTFALKYIRKIIRVNKKHIVIQFV